MKIFNTIWIIVLASACLLTACNKEEEADPSVVGYDYFPLETGDFRVYKIDKTSYEPTNDTSFTYYVKEVVSDTFKQGGDVVYRMDRYYKSDQEASWSLDSVWTARRTNDQAIRTENQTQYLKMVFPLKEAMNWDGNRLNTKPYDEYILRGLGGKDTVSKFNFNKVVTVVQSDYQDLISTDKRKEIYARNVGLIYKKKRVLSHQDPNKDDTTGVSLTQNLIDYGPR